MRKHAPFPVPVFTVKNDLHVIAVYQNNEVLCFDVSNKYEWNKNTTHTETKYCVLMFDCFYRDMTVAVLHRQQFDFKPCLRLQLTVAPLDILHGV